MPNDQGDQDSLEGIKRALSDIDRYRCLHPELTEEEIKGVLGHFLEILPKANTFNHFPTLVDKRLNELKRVRGRELG